MENIPRIVDINTPIIDLPLFVDIDDYIPLRVRSFSQPMGVSYCRIGNYETSLFEMMVDPMSGVVRGITLTSFDRLVEHPVTRVLESIVGFPVLSPNEYNKRIVDYVRPLRVSAGNDDVIITWSSLDDVNRIVMWKALSFFVSEKYIVGCRITNISEFQIDVLKRRD